MHTADGADAPVDGIVRLTLETDGAGFRHAVADRHLRHVHLGDDSAHHRNRARRSGHDAGAQRREIELAEPGMLQFRDEHGRHTVQRRAPLIRHGLEHRQGLEAIAGKHARRAVRHGRQHAEHHAEAVIQRHRDADAVVCGEPHALSDEEPVVHDVEVRQRRALRRTRRAARELDVENLVRVQILFD